jgi:hypothetical protein
MKKPLLIILSILLVAFISIYYIIPQKIQIARTVQVDATDINVARFLVDKQMWQKWWPGKHLNSQPDLFSFNSLKFVLQKTTATSAGVLIKINKMELLGDVTYLAADEGVSKVTWTAETQSSLNPFVRISQYINIKKTGRDVDNILGAFKRFMQTDSNVYGITVKLSKVKNSRMLATTGTAIRYPDMKFVYSLIEKVRYQIKAQGATETDLPMLNIHKTDSNVYQVMAAIPVNREFTPSKGFVLNKMVLGGNMLETTIKGGKNTLTNAFNQLENYMRNHDLRSPAMPFELLVTNRLAEPDTAKWVSKVFYPIY